MVSFSCQICGYDMATARIRTPNEPPSAAWNYQGANFVGFSAFPWTGEFQDQECEQCTTIDRTQANPLHPSWPDCEDEDPDDSGSETDGAGRVSPRSSCEEPGHSPLCDVFVPPPPERLPHGTWYQETIYYTGNRESPQTHYLPHVLRNMPLEHIASPSCQSLQGINGHALSIAQMKNCRNVRFLVPKPSDWTTETSDQLFEESSLFYMSGESNGSNMNVHNHFQPWHSVYPPRHGLHETRTNWEFINEGCIKQDSDVLRPLAVHSYCLDMYAKSSYLRLGRVDLDGLWHRREIQTCPDVYGVGDRISPQRPEVERGRERWDSPWRHIPGDEWLAANPVEIPRISWVAKSCMGRQLTHAQPPDEGFLALPAEIIQHMLSLLDPTDVDTMAKTCRTLYEHAQLIFEACVSRDMPWLWEICEGCEYPPSPDRPVTWDPLCPPGLVPPTLPVGLESEEEEEHTWALIVAENPEMEGAATAAKALNRQRREETFRPYRARQESSLHEWQSFRAGVQVWIRNPRDGPTPAKKNKNMNWRRMWWLCNATTTPLPGLRNRARIWEDCKQIMNYVSLAHDLGEIDNRRASLYSKLSDPSQPGWSTNPDVAGW